ncbi:hypothetical protein BDZ97DRAFT_1784913 [Flammula alnicola]|nr:hypothetical protein BDZ97DRAFT_1784913 [Flammula alnicola]
MLDSTNSVARGNDEDSVKASHSTPGGSGSTGLLSFPPEILLHILSYLDLPDLAIIAQVAPSLIPLTSDPIVSPSRVNHNLFGKSPQGHALRPTGLGIERRWRMGAYFYSLNSIIQYENGRSLSRRLASNVLSVQLRRRTTADPPGSSLQTLYSCHVYPDLKWSLQRDKLAKVFKDSGVRLGIGAWLETGTGENGRRVLLEDEKLRLAVCPDMRKTRGFFERLSKS